MYYLTFPTFCTVRQGYSIYANNCTIIRYTVIHNHMLALLHVLAFISSIQGGTDLRNIIVSN